MSEHTEMGLSAIWLRVRHKLTAYHWRYNRRAVASSLAMCDCGWECPMFQRIRWHGRWRRLSRFCWLRGHAWSKTEDIHCGPVDFDESEDTYVGSYRQCGRCYATSNVGRDASLLGESEASR